MNNLTNQTPNDVFINLLSEKTSSLIFSDALFFWIAAIVLFLLVYLALSLFTEMNKPRKAIVALLIPVVLDLSISFGTFKLYIPILNSEINITHGVLFLSLFDSIFRYQIFSFYSGPLLDPFIASAPETSSNIFITVFSLLSAFSDSILEFIFFFLLFYTLISLIEDRFDHQTPYQIPIAILLSSIPVAAYAIFFSNPFNETIAITKSVNGLAAFFSAGNGAQIVLVLFVFLINFIIITGIMLAIVEIFLIFVSKVSPSTEHLKWSYDMTGVAITYSIAYSIVFLLHSSYNWYVVIPFLFTINYLKSKGSDIMGDAKSRLDDKARLSQVASLSFDRFKSSSDGDSEISSHITRRDNSNISTPIIIIVTLLAVALIYLGYTGFKI